MHHNILWAYSSSKWWVLPEPCCSWVPTRWLLANGPYVILIGRWLGLIDHCAALARARSTSSWHHYYCPMSTAVLAGTTASSGARIDLPTHNNWVFVCPQVTLVRPWCLSPYLFIDPTRATSSSWTRTYQWYVSHFSNLSPRLVPYGAWWGEHNSAFYCRWMVDLSSTALVTMISSRWYQWHICLSHVLATIFCLSLHRQFQRSKSHQ